MLFLAVKSLKPQASSYIAKFICMDMFRSPSLLGCQLCYKISSLSDQFLRTRLPL